MRRSAFPSLVFFDIVAVLLTLTLQATEFIRRFLLHVLPR
jgi:hypothetical protein